MTARARKTTRATAIGKMDPHRESWVRINRMEVVLYDNTDGDEDQGEYDGLTLMMVQGAKRMTVHLEQLTASEITAYSNFVVRACLKALPVAARKDAEALEASQNGDTTHMRLYRPEPVIHVRAVPKKAEVADGE